MVKDDWTLCPQCQFPALWSKFTKFIKDLNDNQCPMCHEIISDPNQCQKIVDPIIDLVRKI